MRNGLRSAGKHNAIMDPSTYICRGAVVISFIRNQKQSEKPKAQPSDDKTKQEDDKTTQTYIDDQTEFFRAEDQCT